MVLYHFAQVEMNTQKYKTIENQAISVPLKQQKIKT